VRIADALGNPHLVRIVADLVTRTNLMSMLYQSQQEASHSADEHEDILRAIEAGNADKAVRSMEQHLRNVEAGLKHRKVSDPVARLQQTLALAEKTESALERAPAAAAKQRRAAARTV
jgi:DNA-binding GntR family transcriptional regulator